MYDERRKDEKERLKSSENSSEKCRYCVKWEKGIFIKTRHDIISLGKRQGGED